MTAPWMIVMGTRPEAIKLFPDFRALETSGEPTFVLATAQHRQMLDQVLSVLPIRIDRDLDLMRPAQTPEKVLSSILLAAGPILEEVKPGGVLVQGDTTTTLAMSLAAFHEKIPLYHVEAGLRTGDPSTPFPEEMNRRLTSRLASIHFTPTVWARDNLMAEGIQENSILVTGNTVIDSLLYILETHEEISVPETRDLADKPGRIILVTCHRRESFGEPLKAICKALLTLADRYPDIHFIYPVHLNPNVRQPVSALLSHHPRIHLVDPLPYHDFVLLMARSCLIVSDSGGVQEEAPSLGKRVVLLRELTERPEGVKAGVVTIAGTNRDRIIDLVEQHLDNIGNRQTRTNPFGDGKAGERIANYLATGKRDEFVY
ncbi:MAG: UDP-N-acetylglucosamine 2-epimerase (non-hydrolyzing) [bacterium]|nr:UDP-N-acetylglucosamine 2-epimerase (non-hydrolyzing) [bacterium]